MNRTVDREFLDEWIEENKPDGLAKLAIQSKISTSTWARVRLGYVPPKKTTRKRMHQALGISEDELFPVLPDGKEIAS